MKITKRHLRRLIIEAMDDPSEKWNPNFVWGRESQEKSWKKWKEGDKAGRHAAGLDMKEDQVIDTYKYFRDVVMPKFTTSDGKYKRFTPPLDFAADSQSARHSVWHIWLGPTAGDDSEITMAVIGKDTWMNRLFRLSSRGPTTPKDSRGISPWDAVYKVKLFSYPLSSFFGADGGPKAFWGSAKKQWVAGGPIKTLDNRIIKNNDLLNIVDMWEMLKDTNKRLHLGMTF